MSGDVTLTEAEMACICPTDICLGIPGESDACGACLDLDPEEACLHDPPPVSLRGDA